MDHQEIQQEEEDEECPNNEEEITVSMETRMACKLLFGLLLTMSNFDTIKTMVHQTRRDAQFGNYHIQDFPEPESDYNIQDPPQKVFWEYFRTLPREFKKLIEFLGGSDFGIPPKVVLVKKLRMGDIDETQNRFSIPMCPIYFNFWTDQEEEYMDYERSMTVGLIEPNSSISLITLSRWRINNKPCFVLTGEWNQVVERNRAYLKKGVEVKVWTFRIRGRLWLPLSVPEIEPVYDEEDSDNVSNTNPITALQIAELLTILVFSFWIGIF